MKLLFSSIFIFIFSIGLGQSNQCDLTLKILKKVFPKHEVKQIEGQKTVVTEVWENHATIPLTECKSIELAEGITVVAFEIFMTDIPQDYSNMLKGKITKESEITEETKYKGTGERLIQVIFYDTKNNKFIGKPEGFPLAELTWLRQDQISPPRSDKIKTFKKIENCSNTILLTVEEFESTKPELHYIFKLHKAEILTKSIRTCIESFQEKNNKLWLHHIENCMEVENEGAEPENVFRILFKW